MSSSVALAAADTKPSHARTTHVLGALSALTLLVASLWWMATPRAHSLEPREAFEERFASSELPAGWQIAQAQVLARGDVVLEFEREGLAPEPPKIEAPKRAEGSEPSRFDWSRVEWGRPGAAPREIALIDLPLHSAKDDLERLVRGGYDFNGEWNSIPSDGGKRILRRDLLAWGELECAAVLEREFEARGTFRDVVRVNLSRAGQPRLLSARFGRGVAGSFEPIVEFLAALEPR